MGQLWQVLYGSWLCHSQLGDKSVMNSYLSFNSRGIEVIVYHMIVQICRTASTILIIFDSTASNFNFRGHGLHCWVGTWFLRSSKNTTVAKQPALFTSAFLTSTVFFHFWGHSTHWACPPTTGLLQLLQWREASRLVWPPRLLLLSRLRRRQSWLQAGSARPKERAQKWTTTGQAGIKQPSNTVVVWAFTVLHLNVIIVFVLHCGLFAGL